MIKKNAKNYFINKKGSHNNNNNSKSKLKSLNKFYITNNICGSIHSKLSKILPNGAVTKESFRNAIKYIITDYKYRKKDLIRRDYITRTIIILIEKYKLNEEFKIIEYNIFRDELEKTIALMTGIININAVREI